MKILALSDSHRNAKLMDEIINLLDGKIQKILFMGDCVEDIIDYIYIYENVDIHFVAGNCDMNICEPADLIVEAGGKKIFMTHGHRYGVKAGSDEILNAAVDYNADICLFGHSHSPEMFIEKGIFFMNPGSISLPRGICPYPTYGLIDIENDKISGKIMQVANGRISEFKI